MKTAIALVLGIMFFLTNSCKQKTHYEQAILGEWMFVKEKRVIKKSDVPILETQPPPFSGQFKGGYAFFPNNRCEKKLGFLSVTEKIFFYQKKRILLSDCFFISCRSVYLPNRVITNDSVFSNKIDFIVIS